FPASTGIAIKPRRARLSWIRTELSTDPPLYRDTCVACPSVQKSLYRTCCHLLAERQQTRRTQQVSMLADGCVRQGERNLTQAPICSMGLSLLYQCTI